MSHVPVKRAGQFEDTAEYWAMNRGGATALVVGDCMAFDVAAQDADTAAGNGIEPSVGINEAKFHNLVNVTASNRYGYVCIVINLADGAGADNTRVRVCVRGKVGCKIGGTDWTAVTTVARLMPETGANRRLIAFAAAAGNTPCGIIADTYPSLAASNAVVTCFFDGALWKRASA